MGGAGECLPSRCGVISPASKRRRAVRFGCVVIVILASVFLSAGAYEPSVTIALLGDVMLARGVALAHATGGWDQTLQSLSPILRSADLALANLESPIDCGNTAPNNSRLLIAPSVAIDALTSAGVDIVSVANNHALDDGVRGEQCTRDALILHGIRPLDSTSPLILSVHGVRLALYAVDLTGNYSSQAIDDLEAQIRMKSQPGKSGDRLAALGDGIPIGSRRSSKGRCAGAGQIRSEHSLGTSSTCRSGNGLVGRHVGFL